VNLGRLLGNTFGVQTDATGLDGMDIKYKYYEQQRYYERTQSYSPSDSEQSIERQNHDDSLEYINCQLTLREKQALEYFYRSICNEEAVPFIAETLAEVHLWNGHESMNPLVWYNIKWSPGSAITFRENQHYEDFPAPHDIWRLPLIAHETMHTMDAQYETRPVYAIRYSLEALWAGAAYQSPYRGINTEARAYAAGASMTYLLRNDDEFRNAVRNGTTHTLARDYREKILREYHKHLQSHQHRYQNPFWIFCEYGPMGPNGDPSKGGVP
jgi:hypothetical protein